MGAGDPGPTLRVEMLGPLRLVVDGDPVDVRGPKRRAVLAVLAMAGGRAVTADHLLDAVWQFEPPESGRAALHSHISRLRGHLGRGGARLGTVDGGYRLALGADEVDVGQARNLLGQGRAAAASDPAAACVLLREALALWRGPPFADLSEVTSLASMAVGLEQLHRDVTDLLIRCAIDAGQVHDVTHLAADALAADPLREPAVLLLMRALAVTGRAPEALQTGREYRHRLRAEAGLDPSAALGELERGIASGAVGPLTAGTPDGPRDPPAGTLPRPLTRLIGRDAQLTAVQRLLATERLVTIVGSGGVGKTRLALQLSGQAEAATALMLAPVTDPAAIPHALAAALGMREVRGDVLAASVAVLAGGPHLLVVDNCEHLLDPVRALLAAVLDGCPELRVLTTSREPIGLGAEFPFRLAPLPLPSPGPVHDADSGRLQQVPSVAVFLERAARTRPGLAPDPDELRLVADIVRRLDGIPLAIELAAGRLTTFSLTDLSRRLDRALDLLGNQAASESRHRTLRSTIQWSYDLLTSGQQQLFRQLSVFADGADLSAVEYVAADLGLTGDPGDTLARLVDASLIHATFDGDTRYRMLQTIRAFGLDQLASTREDTAAARRMLRWAVELTDWIDATLTTEREPEADAVLRRELPNLRAAWHVARRQPLLDDAASLVIRLSDSTSWRDLTETSSWAEDLAADPALAGHPNEAAVLGSAAGAAYMRGDHRQADRLARAGLERATRTEDSWRCLSALALADLSRAAYTDVLEHSLAAARVAPRPSENLGVAALALTYTGELDQARELHERMVAATLSPTLRAFGAYVNGEIGSTAGDPDCAEKHYTRAIHLARSSGATFLVGIASVGQLTVRADAGRIEDALRGYRELIDYWDRSGNWTQQWVTLRNLAQLLRRLGDHQPAALIDNASQQAPDAPAVAASPDSTTPAASRTPPQAVEPQPPTPNRADAVQTARQAIARNLLARRR